MAWGKTEAKEVLGMEPEEFQSKLSKIDAFESRMQAMEEQSRNGFGEIKSALEALKPKETPRPQVDPDISFLENPTGTLHDALKPLNQSALETRIMLEHRNARDQFPGDFERWGNEIVSLMNDTAPEQRSNPRAWEMAVMVVRGRHAADLEKAGAKGEFAFLEPVSAGLRPDPNTSDQSTQAERLMVKKLANASPFGMTMEKYRKGQERLTKARSQRLGEFAGVSNG